MELREFLYELPESLIAAYPSRDRQTARLLVVQRSSRELIHSHFSDLPKFLDPGDVIVLNDTKVFPARLRGTKESGGNAEVLLLEHFPGRRSLWIALVHAAKKPQVGTRIKFSDEMVADVIGDMGRGRYGLDFHHSGDFLSQLNTFGEPPLPPYIRRNRAAVALDWDRYQTIYAANLGAIAAPTAGFHFTPELLDQLQAKGIERSFLTLHVGAGTFQPVRDEEIENHRMAGERYFLKAEAAEKIHLAKQNGRRVVAVGSTTTRALEWIAAQHGQVQSDEGIARLFIHPGDRFRVIDALITNFHLPGSTPLILVAAFAGLDLIRKAYEEAIRLEYRFYSYGDAMLIL